jgi:Uma2 family endonuclease
MSLPAYIERYTVEDWRQWEGDWELVDGAPYAMAPSPSVTHQSISAAIFLDLGEALEDCPHCRALFEIDIEFARDTVVRPDLIVICYQPAGERLTRAPDLIVEIASPTTARRDEVLKFQLYRTEGVSHYLIVYPEERKVKAWRLIDGEYRKVGDFHDETQRFELSKCAIDLNFSRLWRRLPAVKP